MHITYLSVHTGLPLEFYDTCQALAWLLTWMHLGIPSLLNGQSSSAKPNCQKNNTALANRDAQ